MMRQPWQQPHKWLAVLRKQSVRLLERLRQQWQQPPPLRVLRLLLKPLLDNRGLMPPSVKQRQRLVKQQLRRV